MSDFNDLVAELRVVQDDRCGICGVLGAAIPLLVDHDHDTGMVRGLLCQSCNNHEGRHGHCEDWTVCAICRWRRQPPVSIIGRTCHYVASGSNVAGPQATPPLLDGQQNAAGWLVAWRPLKAVVAAPVVDPAIRAIINGLGDSLAVAS